MKIRFRITSPPALTDFRRLRTLQITCPTKSKPLAPCFLNTFERTLLRYIPHTDAPKTVHFRIKTYRSSLMRAALQIINRKLRIEKFKHFIGGNFDDFGRNIFHAFSVQAAFSLQSAGHARQIGMDYDVIFAERLPFFV